MADTKKMFVIILLIISLGIIASNFNITGKATTLGTVSGGDLKETTIKMIPSVVKSGQEVIINIVPGSLGAYKEIKLCRSNGACISNTKRWCIDSYKCYAPTKFKYLIPADLDFGDYYIEIYDYVKEDYVTNDFQIEGYSKASEPLPRIVFEQFNNLYGTINKLIE